MSSETRDPNLPDLRYIRELARVFKQYELDEVEIETGNLRVLLRKGDTAPAGGVAPALPPYASPPLPAPTPAPPAVQAPAATPSEAEKPGEFITSPFVGTFYRAPRPDAPSFVEVGGTVTPGQTLCIVEAMKLFNEIEADFPCVIEEVLVESGQAVEYGAKLFRVRRL